MKKGSAARLSALMLIFALMIQTTVFALASDGAITYVRPEDTQDAIKNPGKGYIFRGYMDPDEYKQEYKDMLSVGYNRFAWSKLEPTEGEYNWEKIDYYIEHYGKQGMSFAFGIECADTWASYVYVTPEWVFDAGAKGKMITTDEGVQQMIPDWTDPIFLKKLNNFIAALAERYDGNPSIRYIDIRSYGNWGEQHTHHIEDAWPDITPEQLKELYVKPFLDCFNKTQIIIPWGNEEYDPIYEWAADHGAGIRRDGLIGYSDGTECRVAYGKGPAIFEYPGSFLEEAREEGNWRYEALEEAVENGRPSYVELYEDMYLSNRAFYDRIANKIGYYFRLKEAQFQNEVEPGGSCQIRMTFRNDGVAPIYIPASVRIGILDKSGRAVRTYPVDADPGKWMPGERVTIEASPKIGEAPELRGKYTVAVGLFTDNRDNTPDIKLGSSGGTKDNWYVLGTVNVLSEASEQGSPYEDLSEDNWAFGAVTRAFEDGIMKGTYYNKTTGVRRFSPEKELSLAEFTVMMARTCYSEEIDKSKWTDQNEWYGAEKKTLEAHGIFSGMSSTSMTDSITRADMAVMIANILRDKGDVPALSEADRNDVIRSVPDWDKIPEKYREQVMTAYSCGILVGTGNGTFNPYATMTRSQAAMVYCRIADWLGK